MAEETRWPPYGDEPPWQWLPRVARQAWRRVWPGPRDLTEADIVPAGAEPICRVCILPYHPLAAICPHCGEIVSRWATLMEPPWIFVWGLSLWRILARARLSRLLCVGLVLSGLGWLGDAASMWLAFMQSFRAPGWWGEYPGLYTWYVVVYVLVAFRMWEAAARAWGSWRLTEDEDTVPTDAP
jgi:hypothetical protein